MADVYDVVKAMSEDRLELRQHIAELESKLDREMKRADGEYQRAEAYKFKAKQLDDELLCYDGDLRKQVKELQGLIAIAAKDNTDLQSRLDEQIKLNDQHARDILSQGDEIERLEAQHAQGMAEYQKLESILDTLSGAVRQAWAAMREGDMWQALGRAMDVVDPSRNEQPERVVESRPKGQTCIHKGCEDHAVWAWPPLCERHTWLLAPAVEKREINSDG